MRKSESRKDKNIQQFVPRAVDLTGMMEAYTRDKRKENLLVTGDNGWRSRIQEKEGKGHLGEGEENCNRWTVTYT